MGRFSGLEFQQSLIRDKNSRYGYVCRSYVSEGNSTLYTLIAAFVNQVRQITRLLGEGVALTKNFIQKLEAVKQ